MSMDVSEIIIDLLIRFAIVAILFLFIREIVVWYFKINARLAEQKETNRLLRILISQTSQGNDIAAYNALGQQADNGEGTREIYNDIPEL